MPRSPKILEELAIADGAAGWVAMIGGVTPVLIGRLPRETIDEIYAGGPDVIIGGALSPGGAVPNGSRAAFASPGAGRSPAAATTRTGW